MHQFVVQKYELILSKGTITLLGMSPNVNLPLYQTFSWVEG